MAKETNTLKPLKIIKTSSIVALFALLFWLLFGLIILAITFWIPFIGILFFFLYIIIAFMLFGLMIAPRQLIFYEDRIIGKNTIKLEDIDSVVKKPNFFTFINSIIVKFPNMDKHITSDLRISLKNGKHIDLTPFTGRKWIADYFKKRKIKTVELPSQWR